MAFLELEAQPMKENPETRDAALREMHARIKENPNYKISRTDDWYLLRFLRYKLFDVNQALSLAQQYEQFRERRGEAWHRLSAAETSTALRAGVILVLKNRDLEGRIVMWLRLGQWRPSERTADQLLHTSGLCGEVAALEPRSQALGAVAVFDMRDLGLEQVRGLSPAFAKDMVNYLGNCFPVRVNGIHIVNEPALFSVVFALFKGFLNERMKKRVFFHGHNMASLHEHLGADCLPVELGGTSPPPDTQEWLNLAMSKPVRDGLRRVGYEIEDGTSC